MTWSSSIAGLRGPYDIGDRRGEHRPPIPGFPQPSCGSHQSDTHICVFVQPDTGGREGRGIIGDQEVFAVDDLQTLASDCGRNHGNLVREGLENLDPRAAAEPDRHDRDIRRSQLGGHIGRLARNAYSWKGSPWGDCDCGFGIVTPNHVELGVAIVSPNAGEDLRREIGPRVSIGLVREQSNHGQHRTCRTSGTFRWLGSRCTFVPVRYHPYVRPAKPTTVQFAADNDRGTAVRHFMLETAPTALIDGVSRSVRQSSDETAMISRPRAQQAPTAMAQDRRVEVVQIDNVWCGDQVGKGKVRRGVAEPDQVVTYVGPLRHQRPRSRPVPPEQRARIPTRHPASQSPHSSFGPCAGPQHGTAREGQIGRRRLRRATFVEDGSEEIHRAVLGQRAQDPAKPLPVASPSRPWVLIGDNEDSHLDRPSRRDRRRWARAVA